LLVDPTEPQFVQAKCQVQLGALDRILTFSILPQLRDLANDRSF
jgi:hypothetical protein